MVRDAVARYGAIQQAASDREFTAAYFADLEKSLGDCYSYLKEYDEAVLHYHASIKHEDSDLTKVFLARGLANLGNFESARSTLQLIDQSKLSENANYDFAISWTTLATRSLTDEDLETAKLKLKAARSSWPIFISQRDTALINLLETSPRRTEGRFKNLIRLLNRYVSLNPNVFGIGIDFNKIMEDVQQDKPAEPAKSTSDNTK